MSLRQLPFYAADTLRDDTLMDMLLLLRCHAAITLRLFSLLMLC